MSGLLRRKPIGPAGDQGTEKHEGRLTPTLSWPHLVALGVGAIVGTGILTLIGVGADRAGPSVLLSFNAMSRLVTRSTAGNTWPRRARRRASSSMNYG